MHRTTPGFRTLHFGDVVDVHLLDDERDNNSVIVEQLAALLVERFGITPGAGDRGGEGADPGLSAPTCEVSGACHMCCR